MSKSYFSNDVLDFLNLLYQYKVKYLIVGGEAVIFYGYVRLTGDIDIFYDASKDNINKLYSALSKFWNNDIPGIKDKEELAVKGMVFQFGLPPNRIDLINKIEAINFNNAWKNKLSINIDYDKKTVIYYIGLDDLIKNKREVKRNKDKDDLLFLIEARKRERLKGRISDKETK